MCGRYSLSPQQVDLKQLFLLEELPEIQTRYNIAPTQQAPIVHLRDDRRVCTSMRWGLQPKWMKTEQRPLINARVETVNEKPSFRNAFRKRRCMVPATGYYEWVRQEGLKQPVHIHMADHQVFSFAGLWEQGPNGSSYTIITTEASDGLSSVHHRMPLVLEPMLFSRWLDHDLDPDEALELLNTCAPPALSITEVSTAVNSVRNDGPHLVAPLGTTR